MSADPLLYSFRRCPYAMRARMALLASGVQCVVREVSLGDKPPEMIEASPKGTVPVLVLPSGEVIDESMDIMRWALAQNDPERWLDGEDAQLICTNDGPFKYHLDRYKYAQRYGVDPMVHRAAGLAILVTLDARLARSLNLCGDNRSLTDIALVPFVRQYAETDRIWFEEQPIVSVQRWLALHLSSPLFGLAMARR